MQEQQQQTSGDAAWRGETAAAAADVEVAEEGVIDEDEDEDAGEAQHQQQQQQRQDDERAQPTAAVNGRGDRPEARSSSREPLRISRECRRSDSRDFRQRDRSPRRHSSRRR
jgi:hypothetical protein